MVEVYGQDTRDVRWLDCAETDHVLSKTDNVKMSDIQSQL
jgi:hypothetical protein